MVVSSDLTLHDLEKSSSKLVIFHIFTSQKRGDMLCGIVAARSNRNDMRGALNAAAVHARKIDYLSTYVLRTCNICRYLLNKSSYHGEIS